MIISIILIALCIILGIHGIYPSILKRTLKRANSNYSSSDNISFGHSLPLVSIIVPIYKEAGVIERRIRNILDSNYPRNRLEIIVVDSGSGDNAKSIIENSFNDVVVISEEKRNGKAHAINLALKQCKGEIVILTDGPTLYQKDTISVIVDSFLNPNVGGVTVLYKIPNVGENKVTNMESQMWSHKDKIRVLESQVQSTSWLSGEACAFRSNTIRNVDEDTIADDSNIALKIISAGFRVIVNPDSFFSERSPSEKNDHFKVKARRALGGLQETLRFRSLLFNRRYGHFGLLIFPYRFFAQIISPLVSIAVLIMIVPTFMEIISEIELLAAIIPGLIALIAVVIFRFQIATFLYIQLILLYAAILYLRGKKSVNWVQSKTTRIVEEGSTLE